MCLQTNDNNLLPLIVAYWPWLIVAGVAIWAAYKIGIAMIDKSSTPDGQRTRMSQNVFVNVQVPQKSKKKKKRREMPQYLPESAYPQQRYLSPAQARRALPPGEQSYYADLDYAAPEVYAEPQFSKRRPRPDHWWDCGRCGHTHIELDGGGCRSLVQDGHGCTHHCGCQG